MAVTVNAQPAELVLRNTIERVDILVVDSNGDPVSTTGLIFELRRIDDSVIYTENFITAPARIVNPSIGKYYFPMGNTPLVNSVNPETGTIGEFLAVWSVTGPSGSEQVNRVQKIYVVSAYAMGLTSDLRVQIDKAVKRVEDSPLGPCYVGYTDEMLLRFLLGGLTEINAYQPYPTFCGLEDFPRLYGQILIEAALLVGLGSQELFAIDTDIPNYSSQGAAFVIQHAPLLGQVLARKAQWLDKVIPQMKLHLVRSGALHVQSSTNFRLTTLTTMAPPGSIFRNFLLGG